MAEPLILETTFLIDFERERHRGPDQPAVRFLTANASSPLAITHTIAGELAAGTSLARRQVWEDFVAPFRLLKHTAEVDWEYGQLYRYLREQGLLIGSNDLWIAATALAYDYPVVTRNVLHYGRVPGLKLSDYNQPS